MKHATIISLDEVLPYVNKEVHSVIEKDDYIVVNYLVPGLETFPKLDGTPGPSIMRNMRGMKFCKYSREIIARPFHKFFNLGERDDVESFDVSQEHVILEKLDGSMVHPCYLGKDEDKHVRWMTKAGITETSMIAERFVARQTREFHDAIKSILDADCTPIFEWCSNKCQIVVSYPEDRLVLTAVRHNFTGKYFDIFTGDSCFDLSPFEIVKSHGNIASQDDFTLFVDKIRQMKDDEGIVIFFDNDYIKIKADDYVFKHKSKEMMRNPRYITNLTLERDLEDDVIALMTQEDKETYFRYQKWVDDYVKESVETLYSKWCLWKDKTRKEYALESDDASYVKGFIFKLFDQEEMSVEETKTLINSLVRDFILKHCSSTALFKRLLGYIPSFKTIQDFKDEKVYNE